MKKIIIIPDVHGRDFWIDNVNKYKNNKDYYIVFLGDYLDPYQYPDGISEKQAIDIFYKVIDVAKSSNNITLLLGNHDLHYFPMFLQDWGCRKINHNKKELSELFQTNLNLFKVAYDININNKKYLFTHAGVTPDWWAKVSGKLIKHHPVNSDKCWMEFMEWDAEIINKFKTFDLSANSLNELINYKEGQILLSIVGRSRGGRDFTGSCMWTDIYDHFDEQQYDPEFYSNIYQIFSHTYSYPSLNDYYIDENLAMLDCKKCFELDLENGKISEIS